jgi:hypothetical protein
MQEIALRHWCRIINEPQKNTKRLKSKFELYFVRLQIFKNIMNNTNFNVVENFLPAIPKTVYQMFPYQSKMISIYIQASRSAYWKFVHR